MPTNLFYRKPPDPNEPPSKTNARWMRWINEHKEKFRVVFDQVPADRTRQMLVAADIWDRLVDADYAVPVDKNEPTTSNMDFKRRELLRALYEKGMQGNAQAARAYLDMAQETAKSNAFDVRVNIWPYQIKDTSLPKIVMEADEKPVCDILRGWAERCRIDKCPPDIIERAEALFEDWRKWATRAYRDVGGVPKLSAYEETDASLNEADVDKAMEAIGATE